MHHVHILNCPFNEILFSFHLTLRSRPVVRNKDKTKQEKQKKKNKQNTTQQEDKSIAPTSQFIPKKIIWVILILLVTEKRFFRMGGKCA